MQLEKYLWSTILRISLIMSFICAATCMNEDSARVGDSAQQLSS